MTAKHGQVEEAIGGGPVRSRSTATNHAKNTTAYSTPLSYTDRTQMETYLLAHGYTQAQLNSMVYNDVVYATRLSQDPGTI